MSQRTDAPLPTCRPAALSAVAEVLGVSEKTLRRRLAEGILPAPVRPAAGRTPALFDVLAIARALVSAPETPRDLRDRAQADFVSLKAAALRASLVEAEEVQRAAESVIRTATARLLRLEDDVTRTHGADLGAAVAAAVRDALTELSHLGEVA